MRPDLHCYGDGIKELADLVGDFDLRSPMDLHAWYRGEWQAIAATIGFPQELEAAMAPLRGAPDRVRATQEAGLAAFASWLAAQRGGVSEAHARTQAVVLGQLIALGRERGELWRVSADPTTLASGACYQAVEGVERSVGSGRDGRGAGQLRAFYPDTAAGYFGDGWSGAPPRAESACGWQTPLTLHLGTFPWVYSTRLAGPGPGLLWSSSAGRPALAAFEAMTSLLDPAANLRQDARQVAAIARVFLEQTRPLVDSVPVFPPGRAKTGSLYRRSGFLLVHRGSLHVAGIDGVRGRLAAPAYNFVLRRFACFFAVRRAALRALASLPQGVRRAAEGSPDPCLRQAAEEVRRGG